MKLLPIITHMRTTMPRWFSRVDAAATYEAALDKSRIELEHCGDTLPAFYLMLGGDVVTNTIPQPEIRVEMDELLSVLAVVKNEDEKGKYSQDQMHDIRAALMSCLLNYLCEEDSYSLIYMGSRMVYMDNARYMHEFQFKQLSVFDADDGFQPELDCFDTLHTDIHEMNASEETKPNLQSHIKKIYPL